MESIEYENKKKESQHPIIPRVESILNFEKTNKKLVNNRLTSQKWALIIKMWNGKQKDFIL
jgi:hypothetical protein